jgi:hypothetical protein
MQFRYFKCKDAPNLIQSKKLNLFVSKISLKEIMNFLKTKKPKLKVFF